MSAVAHAHNLQGLRHELRIRDHRLITDEPVVAGGGDSGPTPMELLAGSLAACTAITLQTYAERRSISLVGLQVDAIATHAKGEPTTFQITLNLPGELSASEIERLEKVAASCPVHRVLSGDVKISHAVALLQPAK